MKNIYSLIVIALSVATFTGCNEDSTPAAGSRPVAQPGSTVRPVTQPDETIVVTTTTQEPATQPSGETVAVTTTTQEQVTQPSGETVVETTTAQEQVTQPSGETVPETTTTQEQATQPSGETVPETTTTQEQATQPNGETVSETTTTQEKKPEESALPTWFANLFRTTPKVTQPKYKLAEGQKHLQIDDLDGKQASRSDLDLTNGNVYFHCEHAQGTQQAPVDFLISRAEYEKQKSEGDLVESEDGEFTMTVDQTVDGQKISVQLGCKTLSRN